MDKEDKEALWMIYQRNGMYHILRVLEDLQMISRGELAEETLDAYLNS